MKQKINLLSILFLFFCCAVQAQSNSIAPKGSLFIIGGGSRSAALIQKMIETAGLSANDHIVVLPMSSEEPDSSYFYIKEQLTKACTNIIANLNFSARTVNDQIWLDSLKKAKLIFITGGDQVRFMKVVLNTPVFEAIHAAYNMGATVAGTSAGAAVMSHYMITGNQLSDTAYEATFDKIWYNNIEFNEGLGLINNAIIDQHFVVRSRYNRLLSALAQHPDYMCIGIDEATAIIIHDNKVTVTGESQVLTFSHPEGMQTTSIGLVKFRDVHFRIYTEGDVFKIK